MAQCEVSKAHVFVLMHGKAYGVCGVSQIKTAHHCSIFFIKLSGVIRFIFCTL
jgi:hypothetical protein